MSQRNPRSCSVPRSAPESMGVALVAAGVFTLSASVFADDAPDEAPSLSFHLSESFSRLVAEQPDDAVPEVSTPDASPRSSAEAIGASVVDLEPARILFGRAGSEHLTFGSGIAYNFIQDTDINVHIAWSRFLADEFEFSLELSGWYFAQDGDDTGGINPNLIFRWHFLHPEDSELEPGDEWDWTMYTDVGIGILAGFDNVPATGTGFDFTPRAGGGMTFRLDDEGTRLQVGLRWHHISNGRIEGDVRNPSRDSLMFYIGVIVPY